MEDKRNGINGHIFVAVLGARPNVLSVLGDPKVGRPLFCSSEQRRTDARSAEIRIDVPALDVRNGRTRATVGVLSQTHLDEADQASLDLAFRDERSGAIARLANVGVDLSGMTIQRVRPEPGPHAEPVGAILSPGTFRN